MLYCTDIKYYTYRNQTKKDLTIFLRKVNMTDTENPEKYQNEFKSFLVYNSSYCKS